MKGTQSHVIAQVIHDERTPGLLRSQSVRHEPHQGLLRAIAPRKWHYLHLAAWLIFLCVGGPILLHVLYDHYLAELWGITVGNGVVRAPARPCNVDAAWSSWDALFQMNLRTPTLSFTAAKLIDVAFDLLVGSGGQAFLAWVAYKVYTDVLVRVAEEGKVGYEAFAAITLKPNSLDTIWKVVSSIYSTRRLWAKSTMVWMVLTMAYILSFPTLMSAATSPVAATTTSLRLNGNETAPLDAYIASAAYSFASTGIQNKSDPWFVPVNDVTSHPMSSCEMGPFSNHSWGGHGYGRDDAIVVSGVTYTLRENATITCGFYYGNVFYPLDTKTLENSALLVVNLFPKDQFVCVPDGDRSYQWGASWELLVLILIAQILWLAGLLLIWSETTAHSRILRQGGKMGKWVAMLELAAPLLTEGLNVEISDEDKLEKKIQNMSLSFVGKVNEF
ncbi:hypothetical protein diail_5289 [Diaporthe ilicicola]|nr:hypothetical protein diail_5289 [Diaporthe ilicicola]